MIQGICGKENSIFTEASSHSIVTSDSRWLPGVNWFIQPSGYMARTSKELEIHFTAVQLGIFSEKRSACDAICSTSSASPSRNTSFLFELWERQCCSRATFQVVLLLQWVFKAQWGSGALCNLQKLMPESLDSSLGFAPCAHWVRASSNGKSVMKSSVRKEEKVCPAAPQQHS